MQNILHSTLGLCLVESYIRDDGVSKLYRGSYLPESQRSLIRIYHLFRHVSGRPQALPPFEKLTRKIAALKHHSVIRILESGVEQGMPYIATPYYERTLNDVMKEAPFSMPEATRIFGQLAGAVSYAHEHGITHCNLRIADIFVDDKMNFVLSDLGLSPMASRIVEETGDLTLSQVSQSGTTIEYISPEQANGKPADPRSDIYALGIILYQLLTGRVPFVHKNPVNVMLMHMEEPVKSPRTYNPGIPTYVEKAIYRALAKEPDLRFNSADEMLLAMLH